MENFGISSQRHDPDNLFFGDFPQVTEDVTIKATTGILLRGTVLGKITRSVPTTGTADGGNTGNGLMTAVAGRRGTKVGIYTMTCITAVTNGGLFKVEDPDGNSLDTARTGTFQGTGNGTLTGVKAGKDFKKTGTSSNFYSIYCTLGITNSGTFRVVDPDGVIIGTFTIPAGAGNLYQFIHDQIVLTVTDGSTDFATADEFLIAPYEHDHIALILMDGSTDFIVGDIFTVTVAVGSRECIAVDSGNSDGSENPFAVLLKDVDATLLAIRSIGALSGDFNERKLIFGGTDIVLTHRTAMRNLSMFTHASQEHVES